MAFIYACTAKIEIAKSDRDSAERISALESLSVGMSRIIMEAGS